MSKFKLNEQEIFNQYADIVRMCIKNGYALPMILKNYDIPDEYRLSMEEKQKLFDALNKYIRERLYDMLVARKVLIENIEDGRIIGYSTVEEYYEDELLSFLERYPMFESILENYNS